jgi:hypothetical protein
MFSMLCFQGADSTAQTTRNVLFLGYKNGKPLQQQSWMLPVYQVDFITLIKEQRATSAEIH